MALMTFKMKFQNLTYNICKLQKRLRYPLRKRHLGREMLVHSSHAKPVYYRNGFFLQKLTPFDCLYFNKSLKMIPYFASTKTKNA